MPKVNDGWEDEFGRTDVQPLSNWSPIAMCYLQYLQTTTVQLTLLLTGLVDAPKCCLSVMKACICMLVPKRLIDRTEWSQLAFFDESRFMIHRIWTLVEIVGKQPWNSCHNVLNWRKKRYGLMDAFVVFSG